VFPIGICVSLF